MRRILIVDDKEEVRDLLATTLKRGDYQIASAASAEEALQVAGIWNPHVIIMDVLMPGGVDGIQATRMLKSDARTRDSKVLVLSGKMGAQVPDDATKAGADAYFSKPFSPLSLLRTVDSLFEEHVGLR